MSYKLKKNHLTNWDAEQQSKEKPIFHDELDSYISERSTVSSLNEISPLPRKTNPYLTPPPRANPQKKPPNLVYDYNKLPENGVPLATQFKQARKQEEQMKKNVRKALPGQGSLVPPPETKPPELGDNYYPYWYYSKVTNPDWFLRHRQYANGELVPYDSLDPSKYIHPPAQQTPSKKSRRHHQKSHNNSSIMQYNPDKKAYETTIRKDSLPTYYENSDQQKFSSNQHIPLNDIDSKHGKLKTENDWNDHYLQSMTTNKISPDSNSNTSKHHHRHRHRRHRHHHSKKNLNILPDRNKTHHHHHSPAQSHNHHHHSPTQSHHHQHQQQEQPKEYVDSEFHVIDASFKKSERSPFFQQRQEQTQNSFQSSPPVIYNQSSFLPSITPNYYNRPNPMDYYYSTLTLNEERKNSLKSPTIYKSKPETNFYDRYLNTVITKKLS